MSTANAILDFRLEGWSYLTLVYDQSLRSMSHEFEPISSHEVHKIAQMQKTG